MKRCSVTFCPEPSALNWLNACEEHRYWAVRHWNECDLDVAECEPCQRLMDMERTS